MAVVLLLQDHQRDSSSTGYGIVIAIHVSLQSISRRKRLAQIKEDGSAPARNQTAHDVASFFGMTKHNRVSRQSL